MGGSATGELGTRLVRISIPRLALGDEALSDVTHLTPWICVPFTATFGQFYLAASVSTVEVPVAVGAADAAPCADVDFDALAASVACET